VLTLPWSEIKAGRIKKRRLSGNAIAIHAQYLRGYGTNPVVQFAGPHQLGKKVRLQDRVQVTHQNPLASSRGDGEIVSARGTIVDGIDDKLDLWILSEKFDGPIGRLIVDDNDLKVAELLLGERFQAAGDMAFPIKANYYDANQRTAFTGNRVHLLEL
jgi:hypothetical protein